MHCSVCEQACKAYLVESMSKHEAFSSSIYVSSWVSLVSHIMVMMMWLCLTAVAALDCCVMLLL
jgi:hypothetical protein